MGCAASRQASCVLDGGASKKVTFLLAGDDACYSSDLNTASVSSTQLFRQQIVKGIPLQSYPMTNVVLVDSESEDDERQHQSSGCNFRVYETDFEFISEKQFEESMTADDDDVDVLVFCVALTGYNETIQVKANPADMDILAEGDSSNNIPDVSNSSYSLDLMQPPTTTFKNRLVAALEQFRLLCNKPAFAHAPCMVFFLNKDEFEKSILHDSVDDHAFFRDYHGDPHDLTNVVKYISSQFWSVCCPSTLVAMKRGGDPLLHLVDTPESTVRAMLDQFQTICMGQELIRSGFISAADVRKHDDLTAATGGDSNSTLPSIIAF